MLGMRTPVAITDRRHGAVALSCRTPIPPWISAHVATTVITTCKGMPIQTRSGVENKAYPNPTALWTMPAKKIITPARICCDRSNVTTGRCRKYNQSACLSEADDSVLPIIFDRPLFTGHF